MSNISSVAVIGLGYIGLPTAAILADKGLRVHGVDVNPKTVAAVNAGSVPFVEPELGDYVARNVAAGRLTATVEPPAADAWRSRPRFSRTRPRMCHTLNPLVGTWQPSCPVMS